MCAMPLELKRVRALTKALFVRAQTAGYRARTKVCAIIDTHTHTHIHEGIIKYRHAEFRQALTHIHAGII